jgi:hypothetical protein
VDEEETFVAVEAGAEVGEVEVEGEDEEAQVDGDQHGDLTVIA